MTVLPIDEARRLVAAGRTLPVALLLSRFGAVHRSMLDELSRYDEESWRAGPGALVQRAMTVPGRQPYRHAAFHLGASLPTPLP